LIVLIVLIVTALFTTSAGTTPAWYTCKVDQAGPAGSTWTMMKLTDTKGSFSGVWFYCRSGQENRQLAVAMTAMTGGMKVYVNCDPTMAISTSKIIMSIYLIAD
jgi:hypothetical protein